MRPSCAIRSMPSSIPAAWPIATACGREISSYVGPLAPVLRFPGEFEMQALAAGALRVLHGQPALDYCP